MNPVLQTGTDGKAFSVTDHTPKHTLRDAFERLDRLSGWSPATAADYRALLRQWESRHEGQPGPDLRQVTEDQWVEFLMSVKTWATDRTRSKHAGNLQKLLTSTGVRTPAAKYGRAPGEQILETVPVLVLPTKSVERSTTMTWRYQTIDCEAMGELYAAAGRLPGLDRIRWQAILALMWFCGARRTDALLMPWEAVDFDHKVLAYVESKKGNEVGPLPLPRWMLNHLRALRNAGFRGTLFGFSKSDITNANDHIYPTLYRIYRAAGVEVLKSSTGTQNQPFHGLRSACVTNWRGHAPDLQRFVTGHSQGSNISAAVYDRVGQRLKKAVDTLPVPDAFRKQIRIRHKRNAAWR